MTKLNRRQWTRSTLAIAALGSACGKAAEPSGLDIIDCHTHFYDPSRPEGIPWPGKGTSLYRTVLPGNLRALPMARPVTGTVVVEASPWVEDNAWLLNLANKEPFIVGIVGNLDPTAPDFARNLKRFAANTLFRGIRVLAPTVKTLLEKNELSAFAGLADHDLALDINGGPETPALAARLAEKLPGLRIVINHIGNVRVTSEPPPADWRAGMAAAGQRPNCFCKISALVEGAARGDAPASKDPQFYRPYIDVVWNAFGDDRVIFGSNWPVCERAADYATLQQIVFDYADAKGEAALRGFCSLNAKRAYKWVERPGRRG